MAFYDEPDDVDETEYIERIVPREAVDLWLDSIVESPLWEDMTPEQHMQAADLFADAVFAGSMSDAEDFLDFLDIEWDDVDIHDFYEAYEAVAH